MGRGAGKTRTGAEWVRGLVESGSARRIALVAPTAADARDVMVEGASGLLSICPDPKPRYEPSRRRLTWPNGAIATTYSADVPDRLRGPQHTHAWCDEIGSWECPEAFDMLLFGLRIGSDPRICVTTTPRPTRLVRRLVDEPTTTLVKGSTYENRAHLAPTFFDSIVATYEGTRLGQQEIHAEILDTSEGAWFARFDPAKHVTFLAEYDPALPVYLGIDAGTSQTTAAVWFQARQTGAYTWRVSIFGEYCMKGLNTEQNVAGIVRQSRELPCRNRIDAAYIDPAASARTGIGPAAWIEYERVFGRLISRSPHHLVADGLDQMEVLLDRGDLIMHPRCVRLKEAFQNYIRASRGGEFLSQPANEQSPHEDMMDALRYGIRSRFPQGREPAPAFRPVRAGMGM